MGETGTHRGSRPASRMSASDRTDLARYALEQVCSGSDVSAAVGIYSPDFHDHVNTREYHGHDGILQSLGGYQLVCSDGDLRIHVESAGQCSENPEYRFVSERADNAVRKYGVTSVSLLAGHPE